MLALLRASHFAPTVAVTAITTALAVSAGRGVGAVWVAAAVVAGQLSVGWSNDYIDRDRDRRAMRMSKPIVAGQIAAGTVRTAALVAALVCIPLSMISGWRAGSIHLAAVALAWAYNGSLRSTIASVVPYTVAFGMLPIFVTFGLPGHPWPATWAIVAGMLMGTGAHFVNTLPDLRADAVNDIRGLTQRIGPGPALMLGAGSMTAATAVLAILMPGDIDWIGICLLATAGGAIAAILVSSLIGHPRLSWYLTLALAALNVAVIVSRGGSLVA